MRKIDRFFRDMAMICLGIILGFLVSPIKKGIRVTIASNNRGIDPYDGWGEFDEEDFDELQDEDFEVEPDFETPDEGEEIPF